MPKGIHHARFCSPQGSTNRRPGRTLSRGAATKDRSMSMTDPTPPVPTQPEVQPPLAPTPEITPAETPEEMPQPAPGGGGEDPRPHDGEQVRNSDLN